VSNIERLSRDEIRRRIGLVPAHNQHSRAPNYYENGAVLLNEVHAFVGKFVAYPSAAAHDAHVLWLAHTHCMPAWESTPRIAFLSPDPTVASPHKPYEIALPDGIGTYGIVWQPGAGELWVMQKGLVRKYNFADPAKVKETRYEPGSIEDVPEPLRDALRKVFEVPAAPQPATETPKKKPPT